MIVQAQDLRVGDVLRTGERVLTNPQPTLFGNRVAVLVNSVPTRVIYKRDTPVEIERTQA